MLKQFCDQPRRLNYLSRRAVLSLIVIVLLPVIAQAQQGTLTDDARTDGGKPNKNYGADETLHVSGTLEHGLLKFKLTPNLPAGTIGSHIGKATLKLFVAVGAPGQIVVQRVTSAWAEQTVTGATFPTLGITDATIAVNTGDDGKWLTIDVTQLVKDWIDGVLPNNGIALSSLGGADVTINSKENQATSHAPQLDIVLNHALTADQATNADTAATATTISGVLTVNKGGTGLSAPGASGNVLRSNGAGWLSAPLVAADFPELADSFIQNTTATQPLSNFNISGDGTASGTLSGNIVNAATQYNLGRNRLIGAAGSGNLFIGFGAGQNNTAGNPSPGAGTQNTFVGVGAGTANTSGFNNAFLGFNAGSKNTAGENAFFGNQSGEANTTGDRNAFFGVYAGQNNTDGCCNSFFGNKVGRNNTNGRSNVFFGGSAGLQNSSGSFNSFLGDVSGTLNTIGSNNTTVGYSANVASGNLQFATAIGSFATVSSSNTVVLGRSADTVQIPGDVNVAGALTLNIVNATTQFNLGGNRILSTKGFQNTFLGLNTGANNSAGCCNAFFGFNAGALNNGNDNSFFGNNAGAANLTGARNSFFGSVAGFSNQTGFDNSFFGVQAGQNNNASYNSFFGSTAGLLNTTGAQNSFFGYAAGYLNTTGGFNTFVGNSTGRSNTTGQENTFVGNEAGENNTSTPAFADGGSYNTFVGAYAGRGNRFGYINSFVGDSAGQNNDNGIANSFFGSSAGFSNVSGSFNAFFGQAAGYLNTGNNNSFFGSNAGQNNLDGAGNAIFGTSAGLNSNASFNSFFGAFAGSNAFSGVSNNPGDRNSFFGYSAGNHNTIGNRNSFFGLNAGESNTEGERNSFFGSGAGDANTKGSGNVFMGRTSGQFNTEGNLNTFVGHLAGVTNKIGSSNTLLGSSADVAVDGLTNATAIGANAQVTQSNTLVLGSISGVNGAAADTRVGIGTTAPGSPLTVAGLIETTNGGLKFPDGTIQTSAAVPGVTAVTATTPLSSSGGLTPNISLTGIVPIANGGTNANTAAAARANLSAAASGANSDITSLSGLLTPLSISQGGTGSAVKNFLDLSTDQTAAGQKTFTGALNAQSTLTVGSNLTAGANVALDGLSRIDLSVSSSLNKPSLRYQSTAPGLGKWQFSNDGTTFTDLTTSSITTDGTTLSGNGTVAWPLAIKNSGVGAAQLADSAVTATKIASGQVVRSLAVGPNTFTDNVTLAAGANVTITPSGNTLTIAATGGGGGSSLAVRTEDGTTAASNVTELRVSNGTLTNNGGGSVSISTGGSGGGCGSPCTASIFNATTQYNFSGNRIMVAGGQENLFVGPGAGGSVATPPGSDNLENAFFGYFAGAANREYGNAFFGNYAGWNNTTGTTNAFFGYQAGQNNTAGSNNTFIGTSTSGTNDSSSNDNTVVGYNSFASGAFNTIIGAESAAGFGSFVGPGSNITLLGAQTFASKTNLQFATAIGAGAIVTSNNTMVLGRPADTVVVPGTFTNPSDARLKTNINDLRYGLSEVLRLRPVSWTWKDRPGSKTGLGLIAQDVKSVLPELVEQGTDKDSMLSLNYLGLLPVLVRAIQEQQATITSLNNEISSIRSAKPNTQPAVRQSNGETTTTCNGNITTDARGEATIVLPDGFESQHRDFRYQLTVIGQFAEAIVSNEIKNNRFTIKTDKPQVKVSWQVTAPAQNFPANTYATAVEGQSISRRAVAEQPPTNEPAPLKSSSSDNSKQDPNRRAPLPTKPQRVEP